MNQDELIEFTQYALHKSTKILFDALNEIYGVTPITLGFHLKSICFANASLMSIYLETMDFSNAMGIFLKSVEIYSDKYEGELRTYKKTILNKVEVPDFIPNYIKENHIHMFDEFMAVPPNNFKDATVYCFVLNQSLEYINIMVQKSFGANKSILETLGKEFDNIYFKQVLTETPKSKLDQNMSLFEFCTMVFYQSYLNSKNK